MNWANLTLVITTLFCAFAAGIAAAQEKMGWASLIFAVGGLIVGFGFGIVTRGLGLLLLAAGVKQSRSVFTFGLIVAYILVPMAVFFGAVVATALLSTWLAQHFV